PEGAIAIEVREFSITPEATALRAGKVRLDVENVGDYRHEFLVVKLVPGTNAPPTVATGAMEENAPGIDIPGRITKTTLTPGGDGELTLNLEPGDYIFACNLVIGEGGSNAPIESHYGRGMHTSFTVAWGRTCPDQPQAGDVVGVGLRTVASAAALSPCGSRQVD